MLDLPAITSGLTEVAGGFWVFEPGSGRLPVSYRTEGTLLCEEVEQDSYWYAHRSSVLVTTLRRFPPADGCVLDVGGGTGHVSVAFREAGFGASLLEPNLAGALIGWSRGIEPVICATLEEASFRDRSLSAVAIFDVLEHVEEDRDLLKRILHLLRPGGRLYLTVPAYRFLWSSNDVFSGHYRRYTKRSLCRQLVQAGFDVDYATYFFAPLVLPILLVRTLPSRLGVRKTVVPRHRAREHHGGKGSLRRLMEALLRSERRLLEHERVLPVGASCLAVVRRPG